MIFIIRNKKKNILRSGSFSKTIHNYKEKHNGCIQEKSTGKEKCCKKEIKDFGIFPADQKISDPPFT